MGKVYIVIMVARQKQGEFVFVRTEKVFSDGKKAELFLDEMKNKLSKNGQPVAINIATPNGNAECICEIGIHEAEVE